MTVIDTGEATVRVSRHDLQRIQHSLNKLIVHHRETHHPRGDQTVDEQILATVFLLNRLIALVE